MLPRGYTTGFDFYLTDCGSEGGRSHQEVGEGKQSMQEPVPRLGRGHEAARAAEANRELTEDYDDPDEMHPKFIKDRKLFASLCRNEDVHA